MLQSMGLQRVGHDWVTELNWTELSGYLSGINACGRKVEEELGRWRSPIKPQATQPYRVVPRSPSITGPLHCPAAALFSHGPWGSLRRACLCVPSCTDIGPEQLSAEAACWQLGNMSCHEGKSGWHFTLSIMKQITKSHMRLKFNNYLWNWILLARSLTKVKDHPMNPDTT